ncbi:MAG: hypothetical protein ACRD9S_16320, partial [Pyrinomonadaceae bacterium]
LWKLGESQARQTKDFDGDTPQDLVLLPDESGGLIEIVNDEYSELRPWSFTDSEAPGGTKSINNVVRLTHLGLTRDGKVLLQGDDRELQLLEPISKKPLFAPFGFGDGRNIKGKGVAAILRQAHDVRSTAMGITATLFNGQVAELYRDKVGARFEVNRKFLRGTVTEGDHVLSPDGKLICGIHRYRSMGAELGSGYDLVIRELATGRTIANHYRLPAPRIVGFTPGNKSVLVQDGKGVLLEFFVHAGDTKAPDWYDDFGIALTGIRLLPNLGLSSSSAEEYRGAREKLGDQLKRTRMESDEVTRFILSHLLAEK